MTHIAYADSAPDPGVLELIQVLSAGRSYTRAELAALTGVSRSTLGGRLETLKELELVRSVGAPSPSGGRPTTHIGFNYSARLVAAIDLGTSHCTVALANLAGDIVSQERSDIRVDLGPEPVLELAASSLKKLLAARSKQAMSLAALTIGVPSPVALGTGQLNNLGPMPGWSGFDIVDWLSNQFQTPVLLENDVNLMALGEQARFYPTSSNLLFLKSASGIGAGMVLEGAIYRGAGGMSGDIGHVPAPRGGPIPCACGNSGCLQSNATKAAIFRELSLQGTAATSVADIFRLIDEGDVTTAHVLRQAGRHLGDVLVYCLALHNPDTLVVGGSLAFAGEHLMAGMRESLYARTIPRLTEHLTVARSKAERDAGILGAAKLSAQHVLEVTNLPRLVTT